MKRRAPEVRYHDQDIRNEKHGKKKFEDNRLVVFQKRLLDSGSGRFNLKQRIMKKKLFLKYNA
jgi:hypothetical protein